jgi:hypothetical protein
VILGLQKLVIAMNNLDSLLEHFIETILKP